MKIYVIRHGETDGNLEKYKHNNCEIHEFNLN